MSDLELVLEQARKCVSPEQIAHLIEEHQRLLIQTVIDRGGRAVPNNGTLKVRPSKFWKFSPTKKCWRGKFSLLYTPVGIGFAKIATPLLELLPITVTDMRDVSTGLGVELFADDWRQMLAYRLLSGIDTFKV